MKRRKSKNYTIWIARTGKAPIVLSLRPLAILLAVGLPVTLVGTVLFSFVRHNNQLSQRNSQLTEEAGSILERVEALESTLTHLQERARISGKDSDESSEESLDNVETAVTEEETTEGGVENDVEDTTVDSDPTLDSEESLDSNPPSDAPAYPENQNDETPDYSQSIRAGMGGPIGAEGLLAAAEAKLPMLIKELNGEVEPALNQIIVREEAKPQGLPLKAKDTEVTSGFGFRPNPFGWGYEFHQGIDFVADYGAPVYATAAGTVVKAEWESGYGNHVIVDHGYGLETLYAHLSDIKVQQGDRVDRQQVLGYLGNTGRSSGPHLHYSVLRNGKPVDPRKYLD